MEPFSVAAAAVALCPIFAVTIKELKKCFNNVRYARREIESLTNEADIFKRLVEDLSDAIPFEQSKPRTKGPIKILFEYSEKLAQDINALLKRVQALISDPEYRYSATEVATAYARWFFSISTVKCIRAMLSVARESINGLLNIKTIMKIDKELQMLKAVLGRADKDEMQEVEQNLGMPIQQRTNILEKQKRVRRVRRHKIEKSIQSANDDVVQNQKKIKKDAFKPRNHQTPQLTEAIKEYANGLLPIADSGRRSRVLSPIDVSSITTSRSGSLRSSTYSDVRSTSITSRSINSISAANIQEETPSPTIQVKADLATAPAKKPDGNKPHCRLCGSHCSCARKHQTSTTSNGRPTSENIQLNVATGVQAAVDPEPTDDSVPIRATDSTSLHPQKAVIQSKDERQNLGTNTGRGDQSPDQTPPVQRVPTFNVEIHSGNEEEDDDTDPAYIRREDEVPKAGPSIFRPLYSTERTEPPNWHRRHLRDASP